jgi:hypothetical protein
MDAANKLLEPPSSLGFRLHPRAMVLVMSHKISAASPLAETDRC